MKWGWCEPSVFPKGAAKEWQGFRRGDRLHSYSFQGVIPNPRVLMQKEWVASSCTSVVSIASGESGMQGARPREGSAPAGLVSQYT